MWSYALLVDLAIVHNAIRARATSGITGPIHLNASAVYQSVVEASDRITDGTLLRVYFFCSAPTTDWTRESLDSLAELTQCKVRLPATGQVDDVLGGDLEALAENQACDALVLMASPSPRILRAIDFAQLRGCLVHTLSIEAGSADDERAATVLRHACDSGGTVAASAMASWALVTAPHADARAPQSANGTLRVVPREQPREIARASEVERAAVAPSYAPAAVAASPVMSTATSRTSARLPAYAEDLPGGASRFYGSPADFRLAEGASAAPMAEAAPFTARDLELMTEVAEHIAGLMYTDERDAVRASGMQAIPAHVDRRLLGAAKRAFGTLLDAPLKKELRRQLWMRC